MRHGLEWTAERIGTLRDLWLNGVSGADIAATIGNGVTKQAVLTKARTIGLKGRRKVGRVKVLRGSISGGEAGGIVRRAAFPSPPRFTADTRALASAVWKPLEGTKPLSLMELPDARFIVCRWPVEGGYCGQPSGDRTYCDHHHAIAFKGVER